MSLNPFPVRFLIYRISFLTIFSLLLVGCATKLRPYDRASGIQERKNKNVLVQPICCSESYIDDREASKWSITIMSTDYLHDWVNDAFTKELMNAGYSIMNSNECVAQDYESSVYTITHGPFQMESGLITLPINVSQGDTRIFGRQYRAHKVMMCQLWELFVPGKPAVQNCFEESLQGIYSEFIEDLNSEITR